MFKMKTGAKLAILGAIGSFASVISAWKTAEKEKEIMEIKNNNLLVKEDLLNQKIEALKTRQTTSSIDEKLKEVTETIEKLENQEITDIFSNISNISNELIGNYLDLFNKNIILFSDLLNKIPYNLKALLFILFPLLLWIILSRNSYNKAQKEVPLIINIYNHDKKTDLKKEDKND